MKLLKLLSERKASLTDRWLQRLFESYPPETAIFLKKEKNRFDNPMGHQLSEGLRRIFEALLQETDRDQVVAALDEMIRIRAIQNFSPSQALAFIFLLKNVIREELATELKDGQFSENSRNWSPASTGWPCWASSLYPTAGKTLRDQGDRDQESGQRVFAQKGMDVNSF